MHRYGLKWCGENILLAKTWTWTIYHTEDGLETGGLFLLVIVCTDPRLGFFNAHVYEYRRLPPELLGVGGVSVLDLVISLI